MTDPARLVFDHKVSSGYSPYRILDGKGLAIAAVNGFLDAQALRNLSPRSLRTYGFDLLNFVRWWFEQDNPLDGLTESALVEYVRYQLEAQPKPAAKTVNHRLTVVRCLYRFHCGRDLAGNLPIRKRTAHWLRCQGPQSSLAGLKLKEPRRVVIPLSPDEVLKFWQSFRSYRDICIVALMLANGLRSREVLALRCTDLVLAQAHMRVSGKGNKERIMPLSEDSLLALHRYLHLERPKADSPYVFVSLKGTRRGQPMTPAGFRSLFRHHRKQTGISRANPHRFRHTFGADMVRAGVALPALMHLMGHASIRTTLLYTELSREDVWKQYRSAMEKLRRPAVIPK
jgi:site-specific recombinase XerD